jgi:hypothetical protein
MKRSGSGPTALAVLLLSAATVSPGCVTFKGDPLPGTSAAGAATTGSLGSFTLSSPLLGNATVTPTGCTSGDRLQFLGGDFSDPASGLVVRLVVDPLDGPVARVFDAAEPFRKSVVLRRSGCAAFHFSLEETGWKIDDVRDYRLSLDLDCSLGDGTSIRGSVSTSHCH